MISSDFSTSSIFSGQSDFELENKYYIECFKEMESAICHAQFDLAIERIDHLIELRESEIPPYGWMCLKGSCYERLGQYELAMEVFEGIKKQIMEAQTQPFRRWGLEPLESDAFQIAEKHIPFLLLHLGRNEEAADLLRERASETWPLHLPLLFRLIEKKLNAENFDPHFNPISEYSIRFLPQWIVLALEDRPQEALAILERVQPFQHEEYYTQKQLDICRAFIQALDGDDQALKNVQEDLLNSIVWDDSLYIALRYLTE